jgi:hypothetical protein
MPSARRGLALGGRLQKDQLRHGMRGCAGDHRQFRELYIRGREEPGSTEHDQGQTDDEGSRER